MASSFFFNTINSNFVGLRCVSCVRVCVFLFAQHIFLIKHHPFTALYSGHFAGVRLLYFHLFWFHNLKFNGRCSAEWWMLHIKMTSNLVFVIKLVSVLLSSVWPLFLSLLLLLIIRMQRIPITFDQTLVVCLLCTFLTSFIRYFKSLIEIIATALMVRHSNTKRWKKRTNKKSIFEFRWSDNRGYELWFEHCVILFGKSFVVSLSSSFNRSTKLNFGRIHIHILGQIIPFCGQFIACIKANVLQLRSKLFSPSCAAHVSCLSFSLSSDFSYETVCRRCVLSHNLVSMFERIFVIMKIRTKVKCLLIEWHFTFEIQ